ncbi:GILT-like protein 1 isoform X2 [Macrosteles quadrilineatus]|uniref:GILT-like protein 1 isoform X2 n=1 Tax=Macrosteles quadrilineatus TaxID=74068 RepID=UPI0023E1EE2C|nr:GILT-like protein 1 isoform X2 [Macrosteles quadrilineatus]
MFIKGGFVVFSILLGLLKLSEQKETLKITVYYETYCPDSIGFIQKQLTPLMGEFNKYPDWLEIDLVPFGFAKEVAHLEFECQHGPKECLGNKLNACAIKSLVTHSKKPHYLKLINFIYCTMNAENQIKAAYKCAQQTSVNYARMIRCYVDGTGDKLIEDYGYRTAALNPTLSWVPTIVFNDVFNKTESDEAQQNLYGVVCRYNPDACT